LSIPKAQAVGILEMLWHFTATYSPRGDIGKWRNREIAEAVFWDDNPDDLVAGLVHSEWLDEDAEYRLVVHDWADHADQCVQRKLKRAGEDFIRGHTDPSFVYFAKREDGLIKIGVSTNVKRRISEIEANTGMDMTLLGTIPGGQDIEGAIQKELATYRKRCEWFAPEDEVLQTIKTILEAGKYLAMASHYPAMASTPMPRPMPKPEPRPTPTPTPDASQSAAATAENLEKEGTATAGDVWGTVYESYFKPAALKVLKDTSNPMHESIRETLMRASYLAATVYSMDWLIEACRLTRRDSNRSVDGFLKKKLADSSGEDEKAFFKRFDAVRVPPEYLKPPNRRKETP
jgi:hypothetical protein